MHVLTDPLGWFTMEVPDGWASTTEDSVTTLQRAGGVGVLYVSGARHAKGRQKSFGRAEFLARFLQSLGLAVDESEIALSSSLTGSLVFAYARQGPDGSWRYWSVTDDETALLISYRCPSGTEPLEQDAVDAMVRSVKLYHSAPN